VFVTGGVIVLTLLQGLVLPAAVRWAQLPRDTTPEQELHLAETIATQEALEALPRLTATLGISDDVADRLRVEYDNHLTFIRARADGDEEHPALRKEQEYRTLRLALVASKRATLVRLRDERRIDDTVLRQLVTRLDNEEVGLAPHQPSD